MISSFLLKDIPRHPDTRLFKVRKAFKRSLLLGFRRIFAHISQFFHTRRRRVALRVTDAEPLISALSHSTKATAHEMKYLTLSRVFVLLARNF